MDCGWAWKAVINPMAPAPVVLHPQKPVSIPYNPLRPRRIPPAARTPRKEPHEIPGGSPRESREGGNPRPAKGDPTTDRITRNSLWSHLYSATHT